MNKKGSLALAGIIAVVLILAVGLFALAPATNAAKPECSDKIDNDGDGNVDYPADAGCTSKQDNDESNCGDGVCEGGETCATCVADCGPCDSCSDTDGGITITTFGTTSGYYGGSSYSNDDYCVDSGNVMEYYCSGDYEQSSQQSCGTDGYGGLYCAAGDEVYKDYTDYFCASGKCDSDVTPVFQEDCDDNDAYGANYCLNNTVFRDYSNYYCSNGACDFTTTPEFVEACEEPYVCMYGQCMMPNSCSDTDGGFVPPTTGTVSGYYMGSPYSNTDYCADSTTLVEYWCGGIYAGNSQVSCYDPGNSTTMCLNGACV
ncbi:MAG: hypothetical protein JW716_03840 [Candidatus Aenigmarchaeota archaeon]|nr:hypothetical protein [Candidatus Aenigmarchaeota archaeon]